jgi:hypothetical protein
MATTRLIPTIMDTATLSQLKKTMDTLMETILNQLKTTEVTMLMLMRLLTTMVTVTLSQPKKTTDMLMETTLNQLEATAPMETKTYMECSCIF